MGIKPSNKATSSKRTTAGSSAKASTTGPKPASPRTRAQKAQEAPAVTAQVDENAVDPPDAMDVVPRYVKVPLGRTNRLNYQQARASAARKNGLPQAPTAAPTAMGRPPLTMFDAPTKVILPTVARQPNQSFTRPDVNAPVVNNNTGGDTDKGEDTEPETPRVTVNQQWSGNTTVPEGPTEIRDEGEVNYASFLSTATGLEDDATDVESYAVPSSPTPAPRYAQREVPISYTSLSLAPQSNDPVYPAETTPVASDPQAFNGGYKEDLNTYQHPVADSVINEPQDFDRVYNEDLNTPQHSVAASVVSEPQVFDQGYSENLNTHQHPVAASIVNGPQTFDGGFTSNLNTHQNPVADIWNTARPNAQFDPCPSSPYMPPQQWSLPHVPTEVHRQSSPCPASYQPYAPAQPLAHTEPELDLAAKLRNMTLQAVALTNSWREYAQVPPGAAVASTVHDQALNAPTFAGPSHYEGPAALPPFASLGPYHPDPASLQQTSTGTLGIWGAPLERRLFKSVPPECLPGGRVRRHYPPTVTTAVVDHDCAPNLELQEKMRESSENKFLERYFNPFFRLFRPHMGDRSRGKRGALSIPKPGEAPREYSPLPARARTKREARPAKGSEEDLILRIEYERKMEAKEARRAERKAEKERERVRLLELEKAERIQKKADRPARKNAKRTKRVSDEEPPASDRPAKKRKVSK